MEKRKRLFKIEEAEYVMRLQQLYLKLVMALEREMEFIPKEIQNIRSTTFFHCQDLKRIIEPLLENIKVILGYRTKKESHIKLEFFIDEHGLPIYREVSTPLNNLPIIKKKKDEEEKEIYT